MNEYEKTRQSYLPASVKVLMIAESPPPADASLPGGRHFYRTDRTRKSDRLFTNTIRALYPESVGTDEAELQKDKEKWLRRFQQDGWYMIEALEESLERSVTKPQRQALIKKASPA